MFSSQITSGGQDTLIINHDIRAQSHVMSTLHGHTQQVCGLKWSPSGRQLASGGNDNMICIWDEGSTSARLALGYHTAAVKALAWCPFKANVLASGGGTADRRIAIWNTSSGTCTLQKDTNSQVCALLWSCNAKELLSSHGFVNNQLCLWSYPTMTKISELTGHTNRVLHMAMAPDAETVVSMAADETLRFWKVFDLGTSSRRTRKGVLSPTTGIDDPMPSFSCQQIR
jgi:cell division cycle protein 20 (cofactor of APC complex)